MDDEWIEVANEIFWSGRGNLYPELANGTRYSIFVGDYANTGYRFIMNILTSGMSPKDGTENLR